jgi:hypothetical protein
MILLIPSFCSSYWVYMCTPMSYAGSAPDKCTYGSHLAAISFSDIYFYTGFCSADLTWTINLKRLPQRAWFFGNEAFRLHK